jgi:hypothetical protein
MLQLAIMAIQTIVSGDVKTSEIEVGIVTSDSPRFQKLTDEVSKWQLQSHLRRKSSVT